MGALKPWHIAIFVVVLVLLFVGVAAGAYPVVRRLTRRLEAAAVQVGAGRAQLRDPLRLRVAVVVGLRCGLGQLRDGDLGGGEIGVPESEDIAALAVFLASPAARRLTGQAISVNGGISAA